jgi:hypothetical protein
LFAGGSLLTRRKDAGIGQSALLTGCSGAFGLDIELRGELEKPVSLFGRLYYGRRGLPEDEGAGEK